MPELHSYDYALVRIVPRVETGEFLNAGAILFCRTRRFLKARIEVDRDRLAALAPELDAEMVLRHLEAIPRLCEGGAFTEPLGRLSQAERFHWLVSPRSTVIQPSPVHCGLCADPDAALDRLVAGIARQQPHNAPHQ